MYKWITQIGQSVVYYPFHFHCVLSGYMHILSSVNLRHYITILLYLSVAAAAPTSDGSSFASSFSIARIELLLGHGRPHYKYVSESKPAAEEASRGLFRSSEILVVRH